uniref:Secreted protein n=1 Tax=Anopheles atroparvus TaxID=41427 RepID=A0AAG5DS19_ANOAO
MIARRVLPSWIFHCTYAVIGVLLEQRVAGGRERVAVVRVGRGVDQAGRVIDGGRRAGSGHQAGGGRRHRDAGRQDDGRTERVGRRPAGERVVGRGQVGQRGRVVEHARVRRGVRCLGQLPPLFHVLLGVEGERIVRGHLGARVPVRAVDDGQLHQLALLQLVLALGVRHEQLLHLVQRALQLDRGPVLGVLDRDQHVQIVGQVLPVRLAPVGVLLLLVAHRALPPDHDLAARLLLELLGRHAARAEDAPDEVEVRVLLHRHVDLLVQCDRLAVRLRQLQRLLRDAVDLEERRAHLGDFLVQQPLDVQEHVREGGQLFAVFQQLCQIVGDALRGLMVHRYAAAVTAGPVRTHDMVWMVHMCVWWTLVRGHEIIGEQNDLSHSTALHLSQTSSLNFILALSLPQTVKSKSKPACDRCGKTHARATEEHFFFKFKALIIFFSSASVLRLNPRCYYITRSYAHFRTFKRKETID